MWIPLLFAKESLDYVKCCHATDMPFFASDMPY